MVSLLLDKADLCGWEELGNALRLSVLSNLFPQQYCLRVELFGYIHSRTSRIALIHISDADQYYSV
jgi:hypothetical protein